MPGKVVNPASLSAGDDEKPMEEADTAVKQEANSIMKKYGLKGLPKMVNAFTLVRAASRNAALARRLATRSVPADLWRAQYSKVNRRETVLSTDFVEGNKEVAKMYARNAPYGCSRDAPVSLAALLTCVARRWKQLSEAERDQYKREAEILRGASRGDQNNREGFAKRLSRRMASKMRKFVTEEQAIILGKRRRVATLTIGATVDTMGADHGALLIPDMAQNIRPDDARKLDSIVSTLRTTLITALQHMMEDEEKRAGSPPPQAAQAGIPQPPPPTVLPSAPTVLPGLEPQSQPQAPRPE
jgi:hypothetical protein